MSKTRITAHKSDVESGRYKIAERGWLHVHSVPLMLHKMNIIYPLPRDRIAGLWSRGGRA